MKLRIGVRVLSDRDEACVESTEVQAKAVTKVAEPTSASARLNEIVREWGHVQSSCFEGTDQDAIKVGRVHRSRCSYVEPLESSSTCEVVHDRTKQRCDAARVTGEDCECFFRVRGSDPQFGAELSCSDVCRYRATDRFRHSLKGTQPEPEVRRKVRMLQQLGQRSRRTHQIVPREHIPIDADDEEGVSRVSDGKCPLQLGWERHPHPVHTEVQCLGESRPHAL